MIGTLAVDGWAVLFGTARRGLGGLRPRPGSSSLHQMSHPTHQRSVALLKKRFWDRPTDINTGIPALINLMDGEGIRPFP